jgi:CHAT domain-containing protein
MRILLFCSKIVLVFFFGFVKSFGQFDREFTEVISESELKKANEIIESLFKEYSENGTVDIAEREIVYNSINRFSDYCAGRSDYKGALYYDLKMVDFSLLWGDTLALCSAYSNCAGDFLELGQFKASLDYNLRAVSLNREILKWLINEEDKSWARIRYSRVLGKAGLIYYKLRDFSNALKYNEWAFSELLLAQDTNYAREYCETWAMIINNIASVENKLGFPEIAKSFYLKADSIITILHGDDSPNRISVLNNLGLIYLNEEFYDSAHFYLNIAKDIVFSEYGKMHRQYSLCLHNLASLRSKLNDYSGAISLYNEALRIDSALIGRFHPDYINGLDCVFTLACRSGDYERAYGALTSLFEIIFQYLKINDGIPSAQMKFWKSEFSDILMMGLNFKIKYEVEALSFNNSLLQLQLYLNSLIDFRDQILTKYISSSGNDDLFNLYRQLIMQRELVAEYYSLDARGLLSKEIDLPEEISKARRLEGQLNSQYLPSKRLSLIIDNDDIVGSLRKGDVYIEIIRMPVFNFELSSWLHSAVYLAYVFIRENRNSPLLVNLGDGKQIDEILYPYLVNQTTNPTSATMDGRVYDLLWKPLEEHLAGKTKIYLSPGGIYHSINPETIYHAEAGKYLFEEKEIHLVNSGRSFVDQRIYGNRNYTDRTALIMGAPNFDYSYVVDSTLLEDNVSFTTQTMRDLSLDGNRRAASLPATRLEVEGINQTLTSTAWNTKLLTGNDALEGNLKQMESPRILHIATHGYFLEDVKPENDNGMRMMGMDVQRVVENPMLRSGLLLAGCNKTLADNTPLTGADNGILTAYEAGLLDLSKTELVVLSACETGKGEILNGEGVQGLRKAMTDAGAEHILMSLWKVDDKVTSEYMQIFYEHYAQGKSIRESYNLTRNEIKQKYPQPYYWGAFVLVGA